MSNNERITDKQEKPIIQSIRDFIAGCPYLPEYYNCLAIDRLEESVSSYSIDAVPCNPIVKPYVNGDSLRQFEFHFSSTEAYSMEILDQVTNSAFFEHFAAWLEASSNSRNLPVLSGSRKSMIIEALTHGYIAGTSDTTARYCIQCRLTYYQKNIVNTGG